MKIIQHSSGYCDIISDHGITIQTGIVPEMEITMPRVKDMIDYFDKRGPGEQKHTLYIEIPTSDWTEEVYIDLPGEYLQLRKINDKWQCITSLQTVANQPKGGSTKQQHTK